jgi:hypothetical protein
VKTIPAGLLAHYQGQVQTIAFCTILSLAARQPRVVNITNANPGVVTTLWQHRLKTGDVVKFVKIEGMTQVNFVGNVSELYFQVTVLSPTEFEINVDTTAYSPYLVGTSYGEARRCLGFTSFERDLIWNNIRLHARTGSVPTAAAATSDFSVSSREVQALLDSDQIVAQDIEEGLYSGAEYEHFEVNYQNLAQGRNVLLYGRLGDIRWGDQAFMAEGLGLKSLLTQEQGPRCSVTCRAELGTRIQDTWNDRYGCKVRLDPVGWQPLQQHAAGIPFDANVGMIVKPSTYNGFYYVALTAGQTGLTEPTWPTVLGGTVSDGGVTWEARQALVKPGTITSVTDRRQFADYNRVEPTGWFTHGLLTFLDGPNAGFSSEVKSYLRASYPITLVDTVSGYFYVTGDQTANFQIGDIITLFGSTAKDGEYTVTAVLYEAGPNRTRVTVTEPISNNTPDGSIQWRPAGFTLRDSTYRDISVGQSYIVEVGCDKRVETCIDKFDNVHNFRGEPYLPGVHRAIRFPDQPV